MFDIEKVSLLDINELIDKGVRFSLLPESSETEFDDLEEYLNNGSDQFTVPI